MPEKTKRKIHPQTLQAGLICLLLVLAGAFAYRQILANDFVNFDDTVYVIENPHVRAGLTKESAIWALTTFRGNFWMPATWLSFMADHQLYGLNPSGFHLTGLILHLANAALVFVLLNNMTQKLWRSAFVAALFLLHPLHVESVAWVAERKDVLSTFFGLSAISMYAAYARHADGSGRYAGALVFFALSLTAKPMLVTLPFILLLLDFWPLKRFPAQHGPDDATAASAGVRKPRTWQAGFGSLLREKIPFFGLSAAGSLVTLYAGWRWDSPDIFPALSFPLRIFNALYAYAGYIQKMFAPAYLAVFYPRPRMLSGWTAAGIGVAVCVVTAAAVRGAQRYPYGIAGWLWYLGTLVPVLGLIPTGPYGMADRFTYVPLIGLYIVIAWAVPDLLDRWRFKKYFMALSAGVLLSGLMFQTVAQVAVWQNSITLFRHAVRVTPDNLVALNNLGAAYAEKRRYDEAVFRYLEALRIEPDYFIARVNLGAALAGKGKDGQAILQYREALRLRPDFAGAHYNLADLLMRTGDIIGAICHYKKALTLKPDFLEAGEKLQKALRMQEKPGVCPA
ncbi:MAG: tetratricopeptide repeat protein [Desulfobacterales bacterium]|nr:tetratricopeptide repeat protein [Desulfobacterales bacterium]